MAESFLFNFLVDDIMRRVDQCPGDVILALSERPFVDHEYIDDVAIFASSSAKLKHVVNFESKISSSAYGLRLRPDKCRQVWVSTRLSTVIRVHGQPIDLVDEFCYLGCMLKNGDSYERDIQQSCAKLYSALNSLTKSLWSTPIANEVKL
ncbi:hypothetical protein RB195_020258 [Necator americanus]|uniref:Reverse transcriptase domain-containing protein n=1 Tax=Necator americanus TaxID=51031 RepID=A0ABR1CI04_NECAM